MRHYLGLAIALAATFLAIFLVFEGLGIDLFAPPGAAGASVLTALAGVGLLLADVFLPVPASIVMTVNGAVFGILLGTTLSTVGAFGGSMLAFWLGRRGGPLLARLVPAAERRRADALLSDWGDLAVIVTRPVPILAESVAILAGASPLGWRRAGLAAAAGVVPSALFYAVAGSLAVTVESSVIVFLAVIAIAGLFWLIGRRLAPARRDAVERGE